MDGPRQRPACPLPICLCRETPPGRCTAHQPIQGMHSVDVPPSAGEGVNTVGLRQTPGQEKKESKLGRYGNTVSASDGMPTNKLLDCTFRGGFGCRSVIKFCLASLLFSIWGWVLRSVVASSMPFSGLDNEWFYLLRYLGRL